MKIYFIGQKGIPSVGGGIETYVEDLSVELAKLGHEVFVYTRKHYTPAELDNYRGVNLISLPSIKTKHLDAISHSLLASLDVLKRDADIVYYQNIGPASVSFIPKIFSRAKVISILQSMDYYHMKWGWVARMSLRLGEMIMCHVSDEIIVVTKIMQEYVERRYGRAAHLVPNGARIAKYKKPDEIKKWGLCEGNYIVSISRLIGHKGIHYLIEAYKNINTKKKLVIVGDGSYSDDYKQELYAMANENKNIIFTGNQTGQALEELYSNAYIFVQPSEAEGMSLALLEAMSHKKAVLVSDIAENKETIKTAGMAFASKNVKELKTKLEFLIKRPATVKKMGELAFQRVSLNFSWDKISRDIVQVFNDSIAKDCRQAKTVRFKLAKRFIGLF